MLCTYLFFLNSHTVWAKVLFSSDSSVSPPKISYYIRFFKNEMRLEVWEKNEKEGRFKLYKSFRSCVNSGMLGPKRKEGDLQIPEGFYEIIALDPENRFYKGLKLNYPNESDLILGDPENPGSDIFIHGSCLSTGCIAMTNDIMDEIYSMAEMAINNGQRAIPVHIFPTDFSKTDLKTFLKKNVVYKNHEDLWLALEAVQHHFSYWHTLPWIKIDKKGKYWIIK